MKGKILVADDDVRINELLQDIFEMEDYEVVSAFNGQEALEFLEKDPEIDLILLDIMMPVLGGWDILPYIKEHFDVKVIILTALSSEGNEVRGFRQGADDYVSKPFSRAVLLERVGRLFRDKEAQASSYFVYEELKLDNVSCKVFLREEELKMTLKEYQILQFLMDNSTMARTREQILEAVWGFDFDGDLRVVDTQIKMLRHSLQDYGQYIRTIRGIGYSFDGKVNKE